MTTVTGTQAASQPFSVQANGDGSVSPFHAEDGAQRAALLAALALLATDAHAATAATSLAALLVAETSNVVFAGSSAALASNATYTGAVRDLGAAVTVGISISYFNALFYADQIGTAFIDVSDDGTTWTPAVTGTAVVASTPLTLTAPILGRYYRQRFVNGATAQGAFRASCAFSRN